MDSEKMEQLIKKATGFNARCFVGTEASFDPDENIRELYHKSVLILPKENQPTLKFDKKRLNVLSIPFLHGQPGNKKIVVVNSEYLSPMTPNAKSVFSNF